MVLGASPSTAGAPAGSSPSHESQAAYNVNAVRRPHRSIRARVCADAIEAAGADRVVTLDLHASQVQGFFTVPVDDLYAMPVLCEAIAAKGLEDLVVVAPDAGFAKKARVWAVEVVSVAGLFGEAIRRIARRESISVLFE